MYPLMVHVEAHIDALVAGEDHALEVCGEQAEAGDFGELFAALCVFCRQKRGDLVLKVLKALDPEDDEATCAVIDAMRYEFPEAWHDKFLQMLANSCRWYSGRLAVWGTLVPVSLLPAI